MSDANVRQNFLAGSVSALATFQSDRAFIEAMSTMADNIVASRRDGRKRLIANNSGSTRDAQRPMLPRNDG